MASFYLDVYNKNNRVFDFYYNMEALINENVAKVLGIKPDDMTTLPRNIVSPSVNSALNSYGSSLSKRGSAHLGMYGSMDMSTKKIETRSALDVDGICAAVQSKWAYEILERAIFYCPKDTGALASTGRVEYVNGECKVVFGGLVDSGREMLGIPVKDIVNYAWYVHEFTWKQHKFPTRAKFLTQAIYEVEKLHGVNWG